MSQFNQESMNLKFFKGAKRLREVMQGPKKGDESGSFDSDEYDSENESQ